MMFSLAKHGHLHGYTCTPKRLYVPYYTHTLIHRCVANAEDKPLNQRVSFDAEVVELHLPEDRRIQVKTAEDLASIARKLCKPILHEVVDGHPYPAGSSPPMNGSHLLAVYDGPWAYYCEIQAEESTKEGRAQ